MDLTHFRHYEELIESVTAPALSIEPINTHSLFLLHRMSRHETYHKQHQRQRTDRKDRITEDS